MKIINLTPHDNVSLDLPAGTVLQVYHMQSNLVVEYTLPFPQSNPPRQITIGGWRGDEEFLTPALCAQDLNKINPLANAFVRELKPGERPDGSVVDMFDWGQDRR